jgi:hypothetical protein
MIDKLSGYFSLKPPAPAAPTSSTGGGSGGCGYIICGGAESSAVRNDQTL